MPRSRDVRFETRFSLESPSYVPDHRVFGVLVVAGASHVSMFLQATAKAFGNSPHELEDIFFLQPFVLEEDGARTAQLVFSPDSSDGNDWSFELMSLPGGAEEFDPDSWVVHAKGSLRQPAPRELLKPSTADIATLKKRCPERVAGTEFYESFWVQGPDAGPSFRWIETLWKGEGEALALTHCPPLEDDIRSYQLHPGLIEACFQVMRGAKEFESQELLANGGDIYVPFHIDAVRFFEQPTSDRLWCHARMHDGGSGQSYIADLCLFDEAGRAIVAIDAFEVRRLPQANLLKILGQDTSDWVYHLRWDERPRTVDENAAPASAQGNWLLLADDETIGSPLANEIEARGGRAVRVEPSETYSSHSHPWTIDPENPEHYERLLQDARKLSDRPIRGVLHAWSTQIWDGSLDAAKVERAQVTGCESALLMTKALVRSDTTPPPRLVLATRGVQSIDQVGVTDPTHSTNPTHAPLWGLARVLPLEIPELECRSVDLDPLGGENEIRILADELIEPNDEDMVAYRHGKRHVARLAKATARTNPPISIAPDASYLVTGGLRGLGLEAAKWLASCGAKQLALMGRSTPSVEARKILAKLESDGVRVLVLRCDVSKADDVSRAFEKIREELFPVRGVVHAAGVLDDGVILQQTPDRFRTVMAPKVSGALHLDVHTRDVPLDFFISFSSATSLLGAGGQSNYAAANAFLDAFSHYRAARGQAATAVNWGPWSEVGMAAELSDRDKARQRSAGWDSIAPGPGFDLLGNLVGARVVQSGVLPLNWSMFVRSLPGERIPRLLEDVVSIQTSADSTTSRQTTRRNVADELRDAAADERTTLLKSYVVGEITALLGLSNGASLDPKAGFAEMGMDSLMSVDLRSRLQDALRIKLSSTFAFDYSNVEDVTTYLTEILFADDSGLQTEANPQSENHKLALQKPVEPDELAEVDVDASIEEELLKLESKLDMKGE